MEHPDPRTIAIVAGALVLMFGFLFALVGDNPFSRFVQRIFPLLLAAAIGTALGLVGLKLEHGLWWPTAKAVHVAWPWAGAAIGLLVGGLLVRFWPAIEARLFVYRPSGIMADVARLDERKARTRA